MPDGAVIGRLAGTDEWNQNISSYSASKSTIARYASCIRDVRQPGLRLSLRRSPHVFEVL